MTRLLLASRRSCVQTRQLRLQAQWWTESRRPGNKTVQDRVKTTRDLPNFAASLSMPPFDPLVTPMHAELNVRLEHFSTWIRTIS
jgi:hypothetical protein